MHLPVLAGEVAALMVRDPEGAFLDLTVGAGGHLRALSRLAEPSARLYGIDQDPQAVELAGRVLGDCPQRGEIAHGWFDNVVEITQTFEDTEFNGILIDMGMSSMQLDAVTRGFSFQSASPLDMRFDPGGTDQTAAEIINTLPERSLVDIIRKYSEERLAPKIARAIVKRREQEEIRTTSQLMAVLSSIVKGPHQQKTFARVFMALRIAVNSELERLSRALPQALQLLRPGGRLAVISYHSLEDRIVKRFFQQEAKGCICPSDVPVCVCGREPGMQIITKKPVTPSAKEVETNPRARSAKLRVAERLTA